MKSKIEVFALFLSGLVLGSGLFFVVSSASRAAEVSQKSPEPLVSSKALPSARTNPVSPSWGNLVYTPFNLTLPDEFFPQVPPPAGSLKWFFNRRDRAALRDLIYSWDLTDAQKTLLSDTNRWAVTNSGFSISIPPELVLQLSPAARQQIYAELGSSEENVGYRYPFRFALNGFDKWFQGTELAPGKVKMVKSLTYTNSGTLCFSDLDTLRHIFSVQEMAQLLQTLYETPTLILKLAITPESNLDALVQYWGAHQRARMIKPLLQSLTRSSEKSEISISELLPPLPRVLLYTFPNPLQDKTKARQDCYWSSLNFFNEQPDNRFLDSHYAQEILQSDYEPVDGAPQFGDLVALYNASGLMMHVCVYIAEDVVFTKNGVGQLQPWVLMKISDLKLKYASFGSVRLGNLRQKGSP